MAPAASGEARVRTTRGPIPTWYFALVVVRRGHRFLLTQERKYGSTWSIPGGRVEPGETLTTAAIREVLEETGVHVRVDGLASFYSDARTIVYGNGDRAQYLDLTFVCTAVGGQARVGDDESTEVGWFAPDALPTPLAPSSEARIAHAKAYRQNPVAGPSYAH